MRRVETLSGGEGPQARHDLRAARKERGQTQAECAAELTQYAGIPIDQTLVSRWERGTIKDPSADADRAIAEYVTASNPAHPPSADFVFDTGPVAMEQGGPFEALIATAAGEPLLAPTQTQLTQALIHRLANGPPMNQHDAEVARLLARTLGLFKTD